MEKSGLADRRTMEEMRGQQKESFAAALDQAHAEAQSKHVLGEAR